MFFSKYIRVKDSNRAEVLAILDALSPYSGIFLEQFIVESESLNAISWVNSRESMEVEVHLQRDKIPIFYSGGLY